MSRLLYFKVIAQHCIVLICGMITINQHLTKFVLHLIMLTEKYFVYLSGVVPVRCMQTTISVYYNSETNSQKKHIWIHAEVETEHQFYN